MNSLLKPNNIKPFSINQNRYFYFVPNGLIIKVNNNDFFEFIQRVLHNKINLCNEDDKFFAEIVSNKINEIEKPTFRKVTNELKTIVLNISGDCNLRCGYCFARVNGRFNFQNMSVKQAIEIIDFSISRNNNVKYFDVCFFGGEPLLKFKEMKEIVELTDKKYPNLSFNHSITTNGTIVSNEIVDFFKIYKFSLMLSFDGPDLISNNRPYENGKSSTQKVLNNINKYREAGIPITIRATITSDSQTILDTFVFLESLKVPFEVSFAYNSFNKEHTLSNYSDKELTSIESQLNSTFIYYYNLIISNKRIYCDTIKKSIGELHFRILNKIACGAGFNNFTFNADGSIYTCQHFANNVLDSCGNINNGIEENLLVKFRAPLVDKIDDCKQCWVRYLCGGCCFAEKYASNGDIHKNITEKCALEKIKWEQILKLSQMINESCPNFLNELKQKYESTC